MGARGFFGDEVFLGFAAASACLADQFSSPETVGTLCLHNPGAVADITLHDALLSLQPTGTLAFVAFGG